MGRCRFLMDVLRERNQRNLRSLLKKISSIGTLREKKQEEMSFYVRIQKNNLILHP